jgi:nucleoside-diphosphate-sugar epimerase
MSSVLMVGGAGFYGRYLVADLLQHTQAKIVVASRRPPLTWNHERVTTAVCDLNDLDALKRLAADGDIFCSPCTCCTASRPLETNLFFTFHPSPITLPTSGRLCEYHER